jgi:subtilisin family serine protease
MAKKSTPQKRRTSPPAKPVGLDADGNLEEATLRRFVFQTFGRARRTQDSPVMPDVWLRYIRVAEKIAHANIAGATPPDDAVDLLLTPWSGVRPGHIAKRLREAMKSDSARKQAQIALSDSRVVARANFETLVRRIVPLSGWWKTILTKTKKGVEEAEKFDTVFNRIEESVGVKNLDGSSRPDIELKRYAALVGFVDLLLKAKSRSVITKLAKLAHRLGPPVGDTDIGQERPGDLTLEEVGLLRNIYKSARGYLNPPVDTDAAEAESKGLYLISLNRSAKQTLFESRATVKADAALRVFDINSSGIVFAIIDGGIDATHPAFLDASKEGVKELLKELPADREYPSPEKCLEDSRIKQTYDFTILRDIVANAAALRDIEKEPENPAVKDLPERIKNIARKHHTEFDHLAIRNDAERDLDWEIVSPLLRVPQDRLPVNIDANGDDDDEKPVKKAKAAKKGKVEKKAEEQIDTYLVPGTDHGTHVAGILAADVFVDENSGRELRGMCPQLSLYDLRVFDTDGNGEEFAILCALEFVGWLNRDRANPVVHGVNLSLALAHDVDSFACGQTPVCEACNHLVGAGTVVVAAAGNTGFESAPGVEKQSFGSGYRAISITDPGNADHVITVGSTHRRDPHLYGVSYFSARGPTGDGRRKPDILAPGEKITSVIPARGTQRMDGTSMASPHVAGAAALLMARYPELIGRPLRIKEILMETATDLKREPSFQGAGLVDVLRALQSV